MTEKERFIIRVTSQRGHCACGHKVGDEFELTELVPSGMCSWAFVSLFPFASAIQSGGSFPWEKQPERASAACPDADNPVVFEVRRVLR